MNDNSVLRKMALAAKKRLNGASIEKEKVNIILTKIKNKIHKS